MPAQNLLNRWGRRRKHPPVRFGGGAVCVAQPPQEEHHASQNEPLHQIPHTEMETDESGTDPEEFDEIVAVSLSELRSNVQCPICLGIIKKTRTVMGCLHRFCRECIDKSMRLGINECPACRIHCASRRSLRDDLDFDALVRSIYPDVDKYEEEELVLLEEEKAVNEQIQASIAQISIRQSEAIAKARKTGKDMSTSTSRVARHSRKCYSRRSSQSVKFDDSSKNEDENDEGDDSTPVYENQASPIKTPPCVVEEDDIQDSAELSAEYRSSPSLVNPDIFTWGRAAVRSQSRHGGSNSGRAIRSKQVQKLADHLVNVQKNEHEHFGQVISTHLQNDETLWLNDYITSDSNGSIAMYDLKPPPQVVERFTGELSIENLLFKVYAIAKQ